MCDLHRNILKRNDVISEEAFVVKVLVNYLP